MFKGNHNTEATAPQIKIVNISLGDSTRPFTGFPSPWARLLDRLAFEHRILFLVSAGNYEDSYDFSLPARSYLKLTGDEKVELLLQNTHKNLSHHKILAPAESLNALTVGALHSDDSGDYEAHGFIDIATEKRLFSPVSRFGHGFRKSIKPEIYFPGGRQLYRQPIGDEGTEFKISPHVAKPGQKVASDSDIEGLTGTIYSCGTSNATALATRAGVQIHQMLSLLGENKIPDEYMAMLIKTLLVHGSIQNPDIKKLLQAELKLRGKQSIARYMGYGSADVKRVLSCTEQRGTVLGFGDITPEYHHEYRFPIPGGFDNQKLFRRMIVTLAWVTPINPHHRNLREAKLELKPDNKWEATPLKVRRADADHNQVKRGTIQHEVLEGTKQLGAFMDNEEIALIVICKKDATAELQPIPYGLAVTLEAAEGSGIQVYQPIRQRLAEQISVPRN